MFDKLRMDRYIAKVDAVIATLEPYHKSFGKKSLAMAFIDKQPDQFEGFTMASFAWKAGIPAQLWAAICAEALLNGLHVGHVITDAEKMYPQHRLYWNRYSAVLSQLTRELDAHQSS